MPSEKVIRDRIGNRIGVMVDAGNAIVARNNLGNRIGHFDKGTGTTRDKFGNRLAHGNILPSLIIEDRRRG